ncbi:hypothetical protein EVG20_g2172 [Dentipellis fragilis]|uniref:Uncharacterized protein n=1 Tax=Dentipellis fragilis TaxID=205917 RepID=A0A4Y9ZAK7_9AGAM|nr:hypothetical protein EVG20_g2172 [Dentipellis fragilis]
MVAEAEKSSKKHARSDSAVSNSAMPATKKAKEEPASSDNTTLGNASDLVTSSRDADPATMTLYAWGFEDSPFEDNHELAAITSNLLASLQSCKPEAWVPDEELTNLPELIALSLDADNADNEDDDDDEGDEGDEDDEDGADDAENGDMRILFGPLLDNEYQFAVICGCEPDFSIMEITLAKEKPSSGPSVKVGLRTGDMSDLDGFMAGGCHPLQKEGYTWVTGVRVDKTRAHLRVVQKIISMHMGMKDSVSDPEGEPNDKVEKETDVGQADEAVPKAAV